MILYNGKTGGLGAYLGHAIAGRGRPHHALVSRLESPAALRAELAALDAASLRGKRVVFMQLAAKVSVPGCEKDPEGARQTNVNDTFSAVAEVCRWAELARLDLSLVYVSSGHVYAPQPEGRAVRETDPVAPRSVYARTKLEAEEDLEVLADSAGRRLLVARVFGLIAPRQPPHYVLPAMIRRVAEGQVQGIPGLSFQRDYLDARDVCSTLVDLALGPPPPALLNVCSGKPVRLRDMLETVARCTRSAEAADLMAQASEAPARPDDIPWIVGDASLVTEALGHNPQRLSLAQTVDDAVELGVP